MITFDVQNDIAATLAKFPWVQPDNYLKLVSNTLNSTAFKVTEAVKAEMPKVFDRPTPYAVRSVYPWRSTPENLNAEVRVRDFAGKGVPAINFLRPEIYGGKRKRKGSELALAAAGLLPDGMYIVPAQGAPLDQYGNLRGAYVNRILSYLKANRDSTQNRSETGKQKAMQFFVNLKPGKLPLGIYERRGNTIRMVIAYVSAPNYHQRLRYFETAQQVTASYFPDKLRREADYLSKNNRVAFEPAALNILQNLLG